MKKQKIEKEKGDIRSSTLVLEQLELLKRKRKIDKIREKTKTNKKYDDESNSERL